MGCRVRRLEADGAGIVGFVAAWVVMVVAMMLPSAAPFVLLYRRGATPEAVPHIGRRSVPFTLRTFSREGAPERRLRGIIAGLGDGAA